MIDLQKIPWYPAEAHRQLPSDSIASSEDSLTGRDSNRLCSDSIIFILSSPRNVFFCETVSYSDRVSSDLICSALLCYVLFRLVLVYTFVKSEMAEGK